MKKRNISTYSLEKDYGFSKGAIHRMKHDMSVTLHTIDTLCEILDCNVDGVITRKKDDN